MKCLSIFPAVISLCFCQQQKTFDELKGQKFEFGLFENVDGSKNAYLQEVEIIKRLKRIKNQLTIVKDNLKTENWNAIDVFKGLNIQLQFMKNELGQLTSEFPLREDFEGAQRAMISLHEGYEFNVTKAVLTGTFSYINHLNAVREFSSHEKLSISDVEKLIDVSMDQKVYSVGVNLMRDLLPLMFQMQNKKLKKRLEMRKKNLLKLNNGHLIKSERMLSPQFQVSPYLLNDKLEPKKKQPEFIANRSVFKFSVGGPIGFDWLFFYICRMGKFSPPAIRENSHCRLLHHGDPYLKLGPFKEEQMSLVPYVVVFHDILSDLEIDFLIKESRPNLSRKRLYHTDNSGSVTQKKGKKGVRVIHKTVQAWLDEVDYPDKHFKETFEYVGKNYSKINYPTLWKLSKKIQLATQLRTDSQLSATVMQVTNYGLAGLCESHIDPHGLMEATELPPARWYLEKTGDMLGTFMAWLSNTEEGGGTIYMHPGHEGIIMPERGAAGFWYDLDSSLFKDQRSRHAGCPVIKGSKWILNKWLYAYDNFAKFPCKLQHRALFDPPSQSHYF